MDVAAVLCGLDNTYFRVLPHDVVQHCLAPYLKFWPGAAADVVARVVANNVKDTHETVEAITRDDNIVVISTRVPSYNSIYKRIDMVTQKRLDLRGSTSGRDRGIPTITCGTGWYDKECFGCPRMYTYESIKPNWVTPYSVFHTEEDDPPGMSRIYVDSSKYFDLPGTYIASNIIDSKRNRVFTRRDDGIYTAHIINVESERIEFAVTLPKFPQCSHTSIAKCGKYWIIMEVDKVASPTQDIDIYDAGARKICTVAAPAGTCKLLSHPTGQKFAIVTPTTRQYQSELLVTMYEITDRIDMGTFV